MDILIFVKQFSEQFDETDSSIFNSEIKFKDLEEWSSLIALSVIVMVDQEYKVRLDGDDMRNNDTIGALFEVIKNRN